MSQVVMVKHVNLLKCLFWNVLMWLDTGVCRIVVSCLNIIIYWQFVKMLFSLLECLRLLKCHRLSKCFYLSKCQHSLLTCLWLLICHHCLLRYLGLLKCPSLLKCLDLSKCHHSLLNCLWLLKWYCLLR